MHTAVLGSQSRVYVDISSAPKPSWDAPGLGAHSWCCSLLSLSYTKKSALERSRGTARYPGLLNYCSGAAGIEPQCRSRNKWPGRREGRQGSHSSSALLLFYTFTIGEKMLIPFHLLSLPHRRWSAEKKWVSAGKCDLKSLIPPPLLTCRNQVWMLMSPRLQWHCLWDQQEER